MGTEFGLYVTLDRGREWKKFMTGLPSVRVDDILIHPRDRDLIIGTHGRSIWIADDITPLEQMKPRVDAADVTLFEPRAAVQWKNDPQAQRHIKNVEFAGRNPQGGTAISVLAKSDMGAGHIDFLREQSGDEHHASGYQGRHEPLPMADDGHCTGGRGAARAAADAADVMAAGAGGGGGAGAAAAGAGAADTAPEQPAAAPVNPDAAAQFGGGGGGGRGRGGAGGGVPFVSGGRGGGGGGVSAAAGRLPRFPPEPTWFA